jgi:hypothetical protein
MKSHRPIGSVAAALGASFGLIVAQPVQAQRQFAVTCIENRTGMDLSYSYRWGLMEWQRAVIGPQGQRWHSWPGDGYQAAPALEISFDYDLSGGERYKTYILHKNWSYRDDCGGGKRYYFAKDAYGNLDLYDTDTGNNSNATRGLLKYTVTCLENKTDMNLSYSIRWGNGEWQSSTVKAWGSFWHSWGYREGEQIPPTLQISFDHDLSNAAQYRQYDLIGYVAQVQDCGVGKKYQFTRTEYGIDLFDPDKTGVQTPGNQPERTTGHQPRQRRKRRVTVGMPP